MLQNEDRKLTNLQTYFTNKVSQDVWKKLNAELKSYSEKQGYNLVMGANGNGSIMYGKEELLDVTEEFLAHANTTYEGEISSN